MSAWINQQMATILAKWWKNKIVNGYRQFSDSNGRVSDTEQLLTADGGPSESRAASTTPPPHLAAASSPSTTPPPSRPPSQSPHHHHAAPHQHLNLEEFSCDVSVEGGMSNKRGQGQEFSFTLYDFDGHGKITKDDIAGLVTTIYEVLGSSVKVPHYGSKTIRVKLTVSPDQRKHVSATVINNQKENKAQTQNAPVAGEQTKQKKRRERRQQHQCCHYEEQDAFSDESDVCSRISGYEAEDIDEEQQQQRFQRCPRSKSKKHHHMRSPSPKYTIPNLFIRENNLINRQEAYMKTRKMKRKSSILQRQELLEIIQANMEKNNLSFQTARKQCTNHVSLETRQLQTIQERSHKHRHRSAKLQTTPLHCLADFMDPTHFYVDLAALQNTTHLPDTQCQYDKLFNAVMCVSNNNKRAAANRMQQGYYRKQQHVNNAAVPMSNIPVRYQQPLNNIENVMNKGNKKTVKAVESEPPPAFRKNIKKFPQVVLGHTSSPHHLRHRNRQEDQERAMAQVVRWLEQEFSSSTATTTSNNNNANEKNRKHRGENRSRTASGEKQSSGSATNTTTTTTSTESGVERHEHHHVHEHIHHHYHHYQETPIVV